MISVPRTPEPPVLRKNSARWLSKLKTVQADPTATKNQISQARDKYRHPAIKTTLKEMFHGKCAYCESKLPHISYGEIEHFYPKSLYSERTFDWSNLLYSCSICNNTEHKGTNFPVDAEGNPLLIDPTDGVTDPNNHLDFIWDDIAQLASIYGRDERGEEVVRMFDLNGTRGRKELIAHRSQYISRLVVLLPFAEQGNARAISLLQQACQLDEEEYKAFTRIYIAPHLERILSK